VPDSGPYLHTNDTHSVTIESVVQPKHNFKIYISHVLILLIEIIIIQENIDANYQIRLEIKDINGGSHKFKS